jgi:Tfp pilus assembly protein PilP
MRHVAHTLVAVIAVLAMCSSAAGQTASSATGQKAPAKTDAKTAAPAGERQPSSPAEKPQQPASRPGQPAAKTSAAAGKAAPAAPPDTAQLIDPPGFAYVPAGRRDPFVSLLRRGSDPRAGSGLRAPGLAGLGVEEITLRGTVRSQEGFVGILQGADQKTYIVRPGDKLLDGTIRTISQNDLVIVQQVNDPLSLEKQREVRKMLRQIEAN